MSPAGFIRHRVKLRRAAKVTHAKHGANSKPAVLWTRWKLTSASRMAIHRAAYHAPGSENIPASGAQNVTRMKPARARALRSAEGGWFMRAVGYRR